MRSMTYKRPVLSRDALFPRVGELRKVHQFDGCEPIDFAAKQHIVGPSDRPVGIGTLDQLHFVARLDRPFGKDSQVPTGAARLGDKLGHRLDAPSPRDFPTRLSWLAHFDLAVTDAIAVANADRRFVGSSDREVFAESTGPDFIGQFGQFVAPSCVMTRRIAKDRLVDSAVMFGVGDRIASQSKLGQLLRSVDGRLVETGRPKSLGDVSILAVSLATNGADLDAFDGDHWWPDIALKVSSQGVVI